MLILFTYLLIFEQEIIPIWQNLLMKIPLKIPLMNCKQKDSFWYRFFEYLHYISLVIVYERKYLFISYQMISEINLQNQ